MPGYVLDGAGRVDLPRQPLAVTVTALDVPVVLRVLTADGADSVSALYPKPGFAVLPKIDAEIVVVATPGTVTGFPQGTVLQTTIAVDSGQTLDPDRAELTPLDVSGLHHVELATVTPYGDRLTVTARKTAVDVPLNDLGARARSAARGVLGVDRLPESRQVRVEVDVDTTMSMSPLIDDGSVREIVDLLTGVAAVVGRREELHVNLIGHTVTPVRVSDLRSAADEVQAALDSVGLGIGFRSTAVDRSGWSEPTLVYTVTDGIPADDVGGSSTDVRRRPIILSAQAETIPAAGTTPLVGGPLRRGSRLDDPAELFETVQSLVAGLASASDSEGRPS
ncbi:hypothetical protein ACWDUD_26040 [Rhodococcus sp. NPDC003382]